MRILITGGNGFIGSNFIRIILNRKYVKKIINIDKNSEQSVSDKFLNFKSKKYIKIKDDLSDINKLKNILSEYQIDTVLHMAAESHVDRSILEPDLYVKSNIIPTTNLLIACQNLLAKQKIKFIYFSTDEVFGSNHDTKKPFTINSNLQPSSPYSASKASAGLLVKSWRNTYKIDASILYCCNNYGPYQNPEKLLPATIFRALKGFPILIYGKGDQIRTWIYVEDTVKAIEKIIKSRNFLNRDFMIGSNKAVTNIKIVNMICNVLDKSNKTFNSKGLIKYTSDRPGHDKAYILAKDQNLRKIGFKIKNSLESGVKKTIYWYIKNPNFIQKKNKKSFINDLKKVGFK